MAPHHALEELFGTLHCMKSIEELRRQFSIRNFVSCHTLHRLLSGTDSENVNTIKAPNDAQPCNL